MPIPRVIIANLKATLFSHCGLSRYFYLVGHFSCSRSWRGISVCFSSKKLLIDPFK